MIKFEKQVERIARRFLLMKRAYLEDRWYFWVYSFLADGFSL